MANVSVRNLDDAVHEALRQRAARAGHSMETEIRQILGESVATPANPFLRLAAHAQEVGGSELEMPPAQFESPDLFDEEERA